MRKWLLVCLLCSLTLLTSCGVSRVSAQETLKTEVVEPEVKRDTVKTVVLETSSIPTFKDVLFMEVPNSSEAASDFLSVIEPMCLQVEHVTVTDYGYGNYTLDCEFTNDDYSILVYVRPEEDVVKWYGSLKCNGEEVTMWTFNNYS